MVLAKKTTVRVLVYFSNELIKLPTRREPFVAMPLEILTPPKEPPFAFRSHKRELGNRRISHPHASTITRAMLEEHHVVPFNFELEAEFVLELGAVSAPTQTADNLINMLQFYLRECQVSPFVHPLIHITQAVTRGPRRF